MSQFMATTFLETLQMNSGIAQVGMSANLSTCVPMHK